jgi:dTDP-4-dehydrorhamnose 3,5-epimerase
MRFTPTLLEGVFVIDIEPLSDERGFFARTYCAKEFEAHGINPIIAQCNSSFNHLAGTLRGLHYQLPPATETKLVRCIRGAIMDVAVDLRQESPTYLQHVSVELSADNRRALLVPDHFAHGYQTLLPDSEITYQVSEFYSPGVESGLRYDDPRLAITWPLPVASISDKDSSWPLLDS